MGVLLTARDHAKVSDTVGSLAAVVEVSLLSPLHISFSLQFLRVFTPFSLVRLLHLKVFNAGEKTFTFTNDANYSSFLSLLFSF